MKLKKIVKELLKLDALSSKRLRKLLSRYPKDEGGFFSKSDILSKYRELLKQGKITKSRKIEAFLKTKPSRTISGVTPVTVLTKPYPCPGNCIFCPNFSDQPKSYLSSEPGAMRAKMLGFDPYLQTKIRIQAYRNNGHNTDKIELIILGGTWSFYPRKYQLWFILRCFQAMNSRKHLDDVSTIKEFNKTKEGKKFLKTSRNLLDRDIKVLNKKLLNEQKQNETSKHRNVGLVIETRPDHINKEELKFLRKLGVTKVQLGIQSLDDSVLKANKRGHTLKITENAINLIRLAGYKIHAHWMANLYKSTPENDLDDFRNMFKNPNIKPDELKIYPCSLIENTELFELYQQGKYTPYSEKELKTLLVKAKKDIPRYCRISRLFRDIPSFEIKAGVRKTNFRQIVQNEMKKRGLTCNCIRCREIRAKEVDLTELIFKTTKYQTKVSTEYFLSYNTKENKLAGFLRLSLPKPNYSKNHFIKELKNSAVIREVHVYGESLRINQDKQTPQHSGIGKRLIKKAKEISKTNNFTNLAVISAVGTREYYRKQNFKIENLYMHMKIIK